MNPLFKEKRLFLVGGSGGVGKTTLAASLGITLAQAGYRTVVLTVDPARRLAGALGLCGLHSDLQKIEVNGGGELWATMLDTERYFDKVIERFAKTPEQKRKVLGNPLYRTMVESLGGSHEYAAMERLLEFYKDAGFDKVVVDTPPSDNAKELFDAPLRLAEFMDNSVLKWFQGGTKVYLQLFRTGTRLAMQALKLVFGHDFVEQMAQFMNDLEGMQAGFRERGLEVQATLRSHQTAFLLVTVPTQSRYFDCVSFSKTLKEREIPLSRLVLNRIETSLPDPIDSLPPAVQRIIDYQRALLAEQTVWAKAIETALEQTALNIRRRSGAIHDLEGLAAIGRELTL
jgi:anion-transporting  ArsA/GET3 family ATPase